MNQDNRKACCRQEANLEAVKPGTHGVPDPAPRGLTVTRCRVCGCRHFEVDADAIELRARGSVVA